MLHWHACTDSRNCSLHIAAILRRQDECIWWFCIGIYPMPVYTERTAHKQQAKGQLSRLWNKSKVDILVTQKYLWEIPAHHKNYLWNWGMNFLPHEIITFFWKVIFLQDCYNCVNIQAAMLGSCKSVDAVKILHIQNCYPKLCSWDDKIQRHLVIKLLTNVPKHRYPQRWDLYKVLSAHFRMPYAVKTICHKDVVAKLRCIWYWI